MKRVLCCLLGISLFISCGSKQPQIDKKIEDGVEVDEVMKTGMTTMDSFCLDREGNIYFMMGQSSENVIYEYDHSGVFLSSFGRNGQGPGEFDRGGYILVDEDNRIVQNKIKGSTNENETALHLRFVLPFRDTPPRGSLDRDRTKF